MALTSVAALLLVQAVAQLSPRAATPADDTLRTGQATQPVRPIDRPLDPAERARQLQFDASRFDTLTAAVLRGIFEEAADRGIPTKPLISRALEGAARKVPNARIIRTVREWSDALATAKFALGDGTSLEELDPAAAAIRAGIDPRTVASVRATRPPGTAVTALVVLTDLVVRGVPPVTAREAVASIGRLPRSDDALMGLQAIVAKNSQRGPGMALDALNRYVRLTSSGTSPTSSPASPERKPVRPPDP
ncbi:MAG: hypothetical protein LCH84_04680 [Gemmatimonadetes bacterium]|nr:hypothetical protein [Gemmatimonadota bacterium]